MKIRFKAFAFAFYLTIFPRGKDPTHKGIIKFNDFLHYFVKPVHTSNIA